MTRWFNELEILLRRGFSPESRVFAYRYATRTKSHIDKALKDLDTEADETREMAVTFFRLLEEKLRLNDRSDPPSKEEVKAAVQQLKDVGRFSVFVTAVILPGGVLSLIGLEMLAKRYGILFSFIPSAFRRKKEGRTTTEQDVQPIPLPERNPSANRDPASPGQPDDDPAGP